VIFTPTRIGGVLVVDLEPREDKRGSFARAWCREEFARAGADVDFVQANVAVNLRAGTLRGLHYQLPPHEEAKLVRCTQGAIWDVALDLRAGSPTHLSWLGVELTAESGRMLFVPAGCAHGYVTLRDGAEVFYLTSSAYAPEAEAGVRWDDPAFGIEWPGGAPVVISEKDASWPDFPAPRAGG
jgi:dTDP-4-dehydrorhamnose 3,5-epimerase